MIYLKRLWNLIAIIFVGCVFILTAPLSFIIEILIITPALYILTNEVYIEEHEVFPFRAMLWLSSKLMFNTNKK